MRGKDDGRMTRLIDGDALVDLINGGYDLDFDEVPETKRELLRMIMEQPTVDAVPVIRCKDCKWFGDIGCAISIVDDTDKPSEDDYCSFAERKENDTDRMDNQP